MTQRINVHTPGPVAKSPTFVTPSLSSRGDDSGLTIHSIVAVDPVVCVPWPNVHKCCTQSDCTDCVWLARGQAMKASVVTKSHCGKFSVQWLVECPGHLLSLDGYANKVGVGCPLCAKYVAECRKKGGTKRSKFIVRPYKPNMVMQHADQKQFMRAVARFFGLLLSCTVLLLARQYQGLLGVRDWLRLWKCVTRCSSRLTYNSFAEMEPSKVGTREYTTMLF